MIFWALISLIATIIAMLLFHEYGHYAVARELGGTAKISWGGLVTEVSGLNNKDLIKTYWGGILLGGLPVLAYIFGAGLLGLFAGGPLLLYYVWIACDKDFKAIKRLKKE